MLKDWSSWCSEHLCVVSHLCIQFSAEHSLPERYKSFFFPIQLEEHFINLKGGAYLKFICISLLPPPKQQQKIPVPLSSWSQWQLLVTILDPFAFSLNTPGLFHLAEIASKSLGYVYWSQWDPIWIGGCHCFLQNLWFCHWRVLADFIPCRYEIPRSGICSPKIFNAH